MKKLTETRRNLLARLKAHGSQFEYAVTSPKTAKALHELGLLRRDLASGGRRPVVLRATDLGNELIGDAPCPCYRCERSRKLQERLERSADAIKTRKQCAKCPWKKSTDPRDIPGNYCETKHKNLAGTIQSGLGSISSKLRVFACHESTPGEEIPCLGWLFHQLGPGNNIGLRVAVAGGSFAEDVKGELVGEQHESFEDTLPQD